MALPSSLRRVLYAAPLAIALVASAPDAFAAGVSPTQASATQKEQAQGRFVRGKELFGSSKYDAALAEFLASFDIVASPNTRLYIARCQRELGKVAPAYNEFTHTAADAKNLSKDDPRYEKTAEAALEERAQLESKVALVTLDIAHAGPETTVKVGGEDVKRENWSEPYAVAGGSTEVVVETSGKPPVKQSVQITSGEKRAIAIDANGEEQAVAQTAPDEPKPVDDGKPKYRPVLYAAGGVAVVGLATFIIAGAMANGTHSDLEEACGAGPCPPGHEDDISAGKTQQTIANVGLAFAIIGAAAAATIFVIDRPSSDSKTALVPTPKVRARVVAGPAFTGITGSF